MVLRLCPLNFRNLSLSQASMQAVLSGRRFVKHPLQTWLSDSLPHGQGSENALLRPAGVPGWGRARSTQACLFLSRPTRGLPFRFKGQELGSWISDLFNHRFNLCVLCKLPHADQSPAIPRAMRPRRPTLTMQTMSPPTSSLYPWTCLTTKARQLLGQHSTSAGG